jgi:hypothetical protein
MSNRAQMSAQSAGDALCCFLNIFSREEFKNGCQWYVSGVVFKDTYLLKLTVHFKINILSLFRMKII